MKKNIAVVGAGYWGRNLVRNFHELGALRVVCDSNEELLKASGESYDDVRLENSFDAVLADDCVEGVVVAVPAALHFELASRALAAGKDVFVEKPLSLTVADGEELVRTASINGRILMVGHILHYHPAVVRLKEMVEAGELGAIKYIYSNRLNMGKLRSEENILWSFAPHDISVILALVGGAPQSVCSSGGAYIQKGIYDTTLTMLDFPAQVKAHIFVSWLHPYKEQKLIVVGENKMAVFNDTIEDKLVVYAHSVRWEGGVPLAEKADAEVIEIEPLEPLKEECRHFIDSIVSRSTPRTDGEEGLRVLKVLEAAERSLATGGCK